MIWKKSETNKAKVKSLMERFGLDGLEATIFCRRGITEGEDIFYFLEDSPRYLHSPFEFIEMDSLVERIFLALQEGEKILVCGDRDVDGITGTAIMVKALKKLGANVDWYLPQGDAGYGLSNDVIDSAKNSEVGLIITVDCGISNYNEIEYASSLGIDVIVTDHHNQPERLPHTVATINPKVEDCGYPYEKISGCAVAYKVAIALEMAKCDIYNRQFTLLDVQEYNEAYKIEAILFSNFSILDRISEVVVPGRFSIENSRLMDFLVGKEILVFEKSITLPLLKNCFGQSAQIVVNEVAPKIWQRFPKLAGQSLYRLKDRSILTRYHSQEVKDIDVFYNIYITYLLEHYSSIYQTMAEYIDLVALGTIADLMPLENENRILLKLGMDKFNQASKFGLIQMPPLSKNIYAMLGAQNMLGKPLSAIDIAWTITPMINATGRMGVPQVALEFFLNQSEDLNLLQEEAKKLVAINEERKKLVSTSWDRFLSIAKRSYDNLKGKFIVIGGPQIPRGITGNLASRLTEYFQTSAMVVAVVGNTHVGSVRSFGGVNVKNLLNEFINYFNDFGGHDYAAGFNLDSTKWEAFYEDFSRRVMDLQIEKVSDELTIDATLPLSLMTPKLIDTVDRFAPYGEQNPVLLFEINGVVIESLELIGKSSSNHVRMVFDCKVNKWVGLYWNGASRVNIDFKSGDCVDVVFYLNRNYFKNRETLQLMIQDIKRHEA